MSELVWKDITPEFDPAAYATAYLQDEEVKEISEAEDTESALRLLYEWGYLSKRDGRIYYLDMLDEEEEEVDEACAKHSKKKKKMEDEEEPEEDEPAISEAEEEFLKRYESKLEQKEELDEFDLAELMTDAQELGVEVESVDKLDEAMSRLRSLVSKTAASGRELRKAAGKTYRGAKATAAGQKGAMGKARGFVRGVRKEGGFAARELSPGAKKLAKGAAVGAAAVGAGLAARAAYKKLKARREKKRMESVDFSGYRSSGNGGVFEAPIPLGTGNNLYESMVKRAAGAVAKKVDVKKRIGQLAKGTVKASKAVGQGRGKLGVVGRQAGNLAPFAKMGIEAAKRKREELKQKLHQSEEWAEDVLVLAEAEGWMLESADDAAEFVAVFTEAALDEMYVGMGAIGTINMEPQSPGPDSYPGLTTINSDGQRAGPKTSTRSAEQDKAAGGDNADDSKGTQERGPDDFPGLSSAHSDGQRVGPKSDTKSAEVAAPPEEDALPAAESEGEENMENSLTDLIHNSAAASRVRECVNAGRNPSPPEVLEMAKREGFTFDNWDDVYNFMKVAMHESLFPVTGSTKQSKGKDSFPALGGPNTEMQKLGPKDSTTGQNKTGARDAKAKGMAPHNDYKKDAPKSDTQSENKPMKVCPVCTTKNKDVSAFCGSCGAVLPPRPEDKDGGIPVRGTTGGKRNSNVASDGGTPNVKSPYGGSKSKHHYLKKPPAEMKESAAESSRVVIANLLEARKPRFVGRIEEQEIHHTPTDVHKYKISAPTLEAVNAKASSLGLNEVSQGELDKVVGFYQQGLNVQKAHQYSGVDVRLCQSVANMMGIGQSHGIDRGMSDNVAPAKL